MNDWTLFLPELALLLTIALFMVMACLAPNPRRNVVYAVGMAILIASVTCASIQLNGTLFNGVYRIDQFSQVLKVFLAFGFLLIVWLCFELKAVEERHHSETYLLLSVSTLAMMMMVSGMHLLVIFLALELSSYSLYILVFLRKERYFGMVTGLRFFLTGASISTVILFGMALIYASAGTLSIHELAHNRPTMMTDPTVTAGMLMLMAGFFFKLALFPFHIWAPDTYAGAPNQVAAFIATFSKLAAAAVLLRIISINQGNGDLLAQGLIAVAVASMTIGNLAAIAQKDFKRLMAFSSIAHAGYIMIGILCMTPDGYRAVLFYAIAVLLMKFTCFLVMIKVAHDGRDLQISELAGLHRRAPLLALALMLALFGLAGIPPTIGFAGKFFVFIAAIKSGYLMLVIIAMINVVISLYYYLLVLKAAYLGKPQHDLPDLHISPTTKAVAVGLIALIMFIGFYPNLLLPIVQTANLNLP